MAFLALELQVFFNGFYSFFSHVSNLELGSALQLTTPAGSGITPIVQSQTTCAALLERCCPTFGYTCGLRYPPVCMSYQWCGFQKQLTIFTIFWIVNSRIASTFTRSSSEFGCDWTLISECDFTNFHQSYGAYPWQAVILAPGDVFQGSGALVDHLHVITAAHRVTDYLWDFQFLLCKYNT